MWPESTSLCKHLWEMDTHSPCRKKYQTLHRLKSIYTKQNINQIGPCLTLSSSNSLSDISLNQNFTRKCQSHTPASQYYASSWTALTYRALRPPCSWDFSEPGSRCKMCVCVCICVCVCVHTVGIPGTTAHKGGGWLKGSFSGKSLEGPISPPHSHSLYHRRSSSTPTLSNERSLAAHVHSSRRFPKINNKHIFGTVQKGFYHGEIFLL